MINLEVKLGAGTIHFKTRLNLQKSNVANLYMYSLRSAVRS